MSFLNACLRVVALTCGAALVAAQVILNLEHLGQPDIYSGIWIAAVAVPIAMAVAVPAMERCWEERHYGMAAATFLALLCGLSHTMVVALERSAYTRDKAAAAKSNNGYDLAVKALEGERLSLSKLEASAPATLAKRNCAKQCRKGLEAQIASARARVDAAQERLNKIGTPVDDKGMERRYGAVADIIDFWHPLLLPLAMELGSLVLIGFALRRGRDKPQPKPNQKVATISEEPDDGESSSNVVTIESHVARDQPTVAGPAIAAFNWRQKA